MPHTNADTWKTGSLSRFWWQWVGANALGEVVGLGMAFVVGLSLAARVDDSGSTFLMVAFALLMVLMGALEGVIVGAAQHWALRKQLPDISWKAWLTATLLGALTAWLLAMIPSTVMSLSSAEGAEQGAPNMALFEQLQYLLAAGMGLVLGVILALFQWRVLRRYVSGSCWWLPGNAVAWAVGMPLTFLIAGQAPETATGLLIMVLLIVALGLTGAVVGAVHGGVMVWLLAKNRAKSPEPFTEQQPGS